MFTIYLESDIMVFFYFKEKIGCFVYGCYSLLPPGGTDVLVLAAGVSCTSDAARTTNEDRADKIIYPNSTSFIFVYEQASTSLQFAFQLVEKWEQLQQTQRKLSVLKTSSPSILSKELQNNKKK